MAIRMAPVASITRKQEPNWRLPKRRRSMTGFLWFSSHGIIATNDATIRQAKTTIRFEPNQSLRWPSSRTTSSEPRKVATKRKPTISKRTPSRRRRFLSSIADFGSWTSHQINNRAITPTGALMRKHQCQEYWSESQPPSVGPTTGATTMATP